MPNTPKLVDVEGAREAIIAESFASPFYMKELVELDNVLEALDAHVVEPEWLYHEVRKHLDAFVDWYNDRIDEWEDPISLENVDGWFRNHCSLSPAPPPLPTDETEDSENE